MALPLPKITWTGGAGGTWFAQDPALDDTGDLPEYERAAARSFSGRAKGLHFATRYRREVKLGFLPERITWKAKESGTPTAISGAPFGAGDGLATAFRLPNTPVGAPTLYLTDWMGRRQLYAVPRANLITYSEQFDNAAWTKQQASIIANADGGSDKLVDTAVNALHRVFGSFAAISGSTYTASVNARNAGRSRVRVSLGSTPFAGVGEAIFDLTAGTIAGIGAGLTASMTALGGSYYRVSITATAVANGGGTMIVDLDEGASSTYLGDGIAGVFLWGAQVEQSIAASGYIPTTVAPVTVTDYVLGANGLVTLASAPLEAAVLSCDEAFYPLAIERLFDDGWARFTYYPDASDPTTFGVYMLDEKTRKALERSRLSAGNPVYSLTLGLLKIV